MEDYMELDERDLRSIAVDFATFCEERKCSPKQGWPNWWCIRKDRIRMNRKKTTKPVCFGLGWCVSCNSDCSLSQECYNKSCG